MIKIQEILLGNIWLKSFSLVVAVVFWFFVRVANKPEVGFMVPLEFRNLPSHLETVSEKGASYEVEVRVKGSPTLLSNLSSRQIKAFVNLSEAQPGETTYHLSSHNISLPRGLKTVKIFPSQVKLTIEPIVKRLVPIEPVILGLPAEGYELAQVKIFPETIEVSGPKSKIEELKAVRTSSIDISGTDKSINTKANIMPLVTGMKVATKTPIEVRVILKEKHIDKKFKQLPIELLPPGKKGIINPQTIDVIVQGPISLINKMKKNDIRVTLDLSSLKPDEQELPACISLPPDTIMLEAFPKKIKIIKIEEDILQKPQLEEK